jgi:hypothetical protein
MFKYLNIPTLIGEMEIYNETEFYNSLTVLIANNPQFKTWLIKIDDEI